MVKRRVVQKGAGITSGRILKARDSEEGADDVAGTAAVVDEWPSSCDICNGKFKVHHVNEVGTAKGHSKTRCKPCFNADRALKKASDSWTCPKRKQRLANMMRTQRAKYDKLVETFRIALPDEWQPEVAEGENASPASHVERKAMMDEYFEKIEVYEDQRFVQRVRYMNRRQFYGYHVNSLLHGKAAAKKKWVIAKKEKKSELKFDKKGKPLVPVDIGLEGQKIRGKRRSKGTRGKETLESGSESEEGRARKLLKGSVGDIGKNCFGVVAEEVNEMGAYCDEDLSEEEKSAGPEVAETAEDDEEALKKLYAVPASLSELGDSPDMTTCRALAKDLVRKVLAKSHLSKASNMHILKLLLVKLGSDNDEVGALKVEEHMDKWKAAVQTVKDSQTSIKAWNLGNVEDNLEKYLVAVKAMHAMEVLTLQILASLKTVRKTENSKKASERRQEMLACRKVLKSHSLVKQGLPKSMMSFVTKNVFGIRPDSLCIDIQQIGPFASELSTFGVAAFKDTCDATNANCWGGAFMNAAMVTMKTQTEKALAASMKFFDDNPKETLSRMRIDAGSCVEYSNSSWSPPIKVTNVDANPVQLQHLDSFAAPFLLGSVFVGLRMLPADLPMFGFGGCMTTIAGEVAVIMVDLMLMHDIYGGVDGFKDVMMNFSGDDSHKFLQKHTIVHGLKVPLLPYPLYILLHTFL
jgi:hypothetical protein